MATSEEKVGAPATGDDGFTSAEAVFVDGDMLDQGQPQPDPDFTTSKALEGVFVSKLISLFKEEAEEGKKGSGKDAYNLKSTLVISGVVVAVIGAIFAIVKKIKGA